MLPFQKILRENIRAVLKKEGLHQKELAKMINMSPANMSRIFKMHIPLSEDHLVRIGKALKKDPAIFFKDIYPEKKTNIPLPPLNKKLAPNVQRLVDLLERRDVEEANKLLTAVLNLLEKSI